MITLKYELVDPFYRENVDLRDHASEISFIVALFPNVYLDKVKSNFYKVTINGKKNSTVRILGKYLANTTSLKHYSRPKKGKRKIHELFRQKIK